MSARALMSKAIAVIFALAIASCSTAASNASLAAGMTPDQTVQVMGEPDLKDSVPDPNNKGATVLRYVWLDPGKVGVFGADNRLASVQQIEPAERSQAEAEAREGKTEARPFDPIATPLSYTFFPIKAAFIYIGAGLNCAAGGGCHQPKLPDPSQG